MKKIAQFLLMLGLVGAFAFPSVAATSKNSSHASSTHSTKKSSKTSVTRKKKVAKSSVKKNVKRRSAATRHSSSRVRQCHFVKKHGRTRKVCRWISSHKQVHTLTNSPIRADALAQKKIPQQEGDDDKMRSAPSHAYAIDGQTFFYRGKKYRIAGMSGPGRSDMAKQRLQKVLDGGQLKIESVSTDETGQTSANVTVDGKNLLDQLK